MSEGLSSVFCYEMWIVQSKTFCDVWCLSGISCISKVLEMLSISKIDDQKSVLCLFVYCIPILIMIKLQISLSILLENLKWRCNLHKKLAQDLCPLGARFFRKEAFHSSSPSLGILWNRTPAASRSVGEPEEHPLLDLYCCTWKRSFLTKWWGMELKHGSVSSSKTSFFLFFSSFFFCHLEQSAHGRLIRSYVSSTLGSIGCMVQQQPSPFCARTSLLLGHFFLAAIAARDTLTSYVGVLKMISQGNR